MLTRLRLVYNKTKYFMLCLFDEVGLREPRDLRQTLRETDEDI